LDRENAKKVSSGSPLLLDRFLGIENGPFPSRFFSVGRNHTAPLTRVLPNGKESLSRPVSSADDLGFVWIEFL